MLLKHPQFMCRAVWSEPGVARNIRVAAAITRPGHVPAGMQHKIGHWSGRELRKWTRQPTHMRDGTRADLGPIPAKYEATGLPIAPQMSVRRMQVAPLERSFILHPEGPVLLLDHR